MKRFLVAVCASAILLGCSGARASPCSDEDVLDTAAKILNEKVVTPYNHFMDDIQDLTQSNPSMAKMYLNILGTKDVVFAPIAKRDDIENIIITDQTQYKTSCKAQYNNDDFTYTVEKTEDGRNYVDITFGHTLSLAMQRVVELSEQADDLVTIPKSKEYQDLLQKFEGKVK
jgi:hypothetical protein